MKMRIKNPANWLVLSGLWVVAGVGPIDDEGFIQRVLPGVGGPSSVWAQSQWTNPAVGGQAGDWFEASNWSPVGVPDATTDVLIDNGGQASATSATAIGSVEAGVLSVGPNGNEGLLFVTGVDVITGGDLQVGQVFLEDALAEIEGVGVMAVSDTPLVDIGSDVAVAKAFTAETSSALITGSLNVNRVNQWLIDDDLTLGESVANGNALATTRGFVTVVDVPTLQIGRGLDVGSAATADSGVATGEGTLDVTNVSSLTLGRGLAIGQSNSSGHVVLPRRRVRRR